MEKAISAFALSPDAIALAAILTQGSARHALLPAAIVSVDATALAAMLSRMPRDVPLLGLALSPPQQSLVAVIHRGAPGKAILALGTSETSQSIAHVLKGAAMPPDIVMGLMLVLAGYDNLRIMWVQPGLGTGILLNYEFELDGSGVWISTMSAATEYTITGLHRRTLPTPSAYAPLPTSGAAPVPQLWRHDTLATHTHSAAVRARRRPRRPVH